jgi:hypothetical protein
MRLPAFALPVLFATALSIPATAAAAPAAPAATTAKPGPKDTVDQNRVHAEYGDGNFETVVQILEDYRARHEAYRPTDSVFIAKYLGVVYASNPASREKGKYWLYKMLQMDPRSDLVDLYVGEEVESTFEKVRQEFIVRRNYRGVNDTRLAKAVESDAPKRDTVVLKDTVVVKKDTWISPVTDGIKGGYSEVKGGIKAGIEAGYVPIKEEVRDDDTRWTGNINMGAGIKFLNADEWQDVAGFTDETEVRASLDIRQRRWPINIAVDFGYAFAPDVYQDLTGGATDEGIAKQSVVTYEVNVGVRKIVDFKLYSVRPFFGGGFGRVTTEWDLKSDKIDRALREGKIGVWFNGGCYWELDKHFNIGVDYLYSWARIDMYGQRNHGGHHFDMIAGYHF